MSLTSLILAAAETHGEEGGVSPVVVGLVALAILLALLISLLAFGKGREHS